VPEVVGAVEVSEAEPEIGAEVRPTGVEEAAAADVLREPEDVDELAKMPERVEWAAEDVEDTAALELEADSGFV
jgi:hypothetical protein